MRQAVTSAPGKLMIAGEYAVLEGAEAIVAAVGRRAVARLREGTQGPLAPEAAAARAAAERRLGAVPYALSVDVEQLRSDGRKLGLGSSSAAAAAAAGAIYAAHGRDTRDERVRAELLLDALEGHRAVAPEGSGADVAAAVLGGFVRFRRLGQGVETHALRWPAAVRLVVVWTGRAVRTSDMLEKVRALAARQPALHRACMRGLAEQSDQLISAVLAGEPKPIVDCFHSFGTAMGELGEAAGAPIIEDTTKQIRELAIRCRGGAKPSGAGGGDVVLAAFSAEHDVRDFEAQCAASRFEVLSIELGVPGERDEESE